MKSYIFRFLGGCLGLSFIIAGAFLLTPMFPAGFLSILNAISFLIVGAYFIFYGFTGKSTFKSNRELNK